MRTFTKLFLAAFLLLPLAVAAVPREKESSIDSLEAVNRTLKAEYELAKKQKIYFIFDLQGRMVHVKASGASLAEWPISRYSKWGQPSSSATKILVEKDSFFEPRRMVIAPEGPKETKEGQSFELKALELEDMPTHYVLTFDDGTRITVRGTPKTFVARIGQRIANGFWHLTRPLIFDWKFLQGKPYTELLLTLPRNDARRLYWSISEEAPGLIIWPREDD